MCWKCQNQNKNKKCSQCRGREKITGNDNMIKFMEYIMEFKLHLCNEYINQKSESKEREKKISTNLLKSMNISSQRKSSSPPEKFNNFATYKERCVEKVKHFGYICDECDEEPIEGTRYHCK